MQFNQSAILSLFLAVFKLTEFQKENKTKTKISLSEIFKI